MSPEWPRYIPVAERRAKTAKKIHTLRKSGKEINPINIEGRKITHTFWGNAWCAHLEKFSDYANRLPRGRTYVRNGSVCHLEIGRGTVSALVSGSKMYRIEIAIAPLATKQWNAIRRSCSGEIGSLLELMQGTLSDNVMKTVTATQSGLFPIPKDIIFNCNCPDWAIMCKHVAAVLYGVGARLDQSPELLFLLRAVDHQDLIVSDITLHKPQRKMPQVTGDLSAIFGIDLDEEHTPLKQATHTKIPSQKPAAAPDTESIRPLVKRSKKSGPSTDKTTITISRGIRASHIKRLRTRFGMSQGEFSQLIGLSVHTVRSWEGKKGPLGLQKKSRAVLEKFFALNKVQAWNAMTMQ